jgi:hypothetical protein
MGNKHGIIGLILVLVITISLTLSAGCSFESKMPGDLRVYRTDESGTVLWNATIVTGLNQFAYDIGETSHHDLVVGTPRTFVARIDPGGNVSKKSPPGDDLVLSSIPTSDGGRLAIVDTVSKFNALGWWKEWDAPIAAPAGAIRLMNGNYIVAGHRDINDLFAQVFCLAPDGSILWDHDAIFINTDPSTIEFYSITSLHESKDRVIEVTSTNALGKRPRLMGSTQMDFAQDGTLIRVKNISAFYPMTRTSEDDYVFVAWPRANGEGNTADFTRGGTVHIVKVSHEGTLIWDRELPYSRDGRPLSIIQTSDGGYAVLLGIEMSRITVQNSSHADTARNISQEEAVQIVLRDPTVISWINNSMNNTEFEVQEVDRMTIGGDRPGIPAEDRWVVPLLMHINNLTYHYTIEVGMNGTIMYYRHPRTLYPPPPDWVSPGR